MHWKQNKSENCYASYMGKIYWAYWGLQAHTGISDIYKLWKETIERVFADVKEKQAMRYTQYRGLAKVKAEAPLRFACMNLKKLAKWKRIKGLLRSFIRGFIQILAQVIQKSVATLDLQPILSTVWASHKNDLLNGGGEGEIWTLAPLSRPTPLAGAPLRPLEYFSELILPYKHTRWVLI